jgi:hypothetical protein
MPASWFVSSLDRAVKRLSAEYTDQTREDSMREGWYGDDYLILFNESEASSAAERYEISQLLPGYKVIGLRGWDDFILEDSNGETYSVPTVPAIPTYLEAYGLPPAGSVLAPDDRFQNKIKWYVKPLVFGGDPKTGENAIWVTHDEHAQFVKWWNGLYRSMNMSLNERNAAANAVQSDE